MNRLKLAEELIKIAGSLNKTALLEPQVGKTYWCTAYHEMVKVVDKMIRKGLGNNDLFGVEAKNGEQFSVPGYTLRVASSKTASIDPAGTAKAIREILKKKYPAIKFSITSTPKGGTSARVVWMDGPTAPQIEKLIEHHEMGHFDPSDDSYKFTNTNEAIPQVKYLMCSRNMSDKVRDLLVAEESKNWGIDITDDQLCKEKTGRWSDTYLWTVFKDREF